MACRFRPATARGPKNRLVRLCTPSDGLQDSGGGRTRPHPGVAAVSAASAARQSCSSCLLQPALSRLLLDEESATVASAASTPRL